MTNCVDEHDFKNASQVRPKYMSPILKPLLKIPVMSIDVCPQPFQSLLYRIKIVLHLFNVILTLCSFTPEDFLLPLALFHFLHVAKKQYIHGGILLLRHSTKRGSRIIPIYTL